MTGQRVRQSKDMSGQYPILTGRFALTGRYFDPCVCTVKFESVVEYFTVHLYKYMQACVSKLLCFVLFVGRSLDLY